MQIFGTIANMGQVLMWVWWVFWILLFLTLIAALMKYIQTKNQTTVTQTKNAMEILKERYARSEITREEFEEKKRIIS